MSTCKRSKEEETKWFLLGNDSLFCFANGQTVHKETSLSDWVTWGTTLERKDILDKEGWPSLQCQVWKSLSNFLIVAKLYKVLWKTVEGALAMRIEPRSMYCSKM